MSVLQFLGIEKSLKQRGDTECQVQETLAGPLVLYSLCLMGQWMVPRKQNHAGMWQVSCQALPTMAQGQLH